MRVTNQPTRCWVRYSSAVRELPRGQYAWHPGWQGPVSVTVVSRVCSVTMVALVACTPLALVAIQPVTSVGWCRPNVVALVTWCGCPAVPGDAVGVFPPRSTTLTMVAW